MFDEPQKAHMFPFIHLQNVYQVPVHPKSRDLSAFITMKALASFLRGFQKKDDVASVGLGWWPVLFE